MTTLPIKLISEERWPWEVNQKEISPKGLSMIMWVLGAGAQALAAGGCRASVKRGQGCPILLTSSSGPPQLPHCRAQVGPATGEHLTEKGFRKG